MPNAGAGSTEALTFRPRTPEDDEWIVDLLGRLGPEYPPLDVLEFRAQIDSVPPSASWEITIAERDGKRVGTYMLIQMFWVEQPGAFNFELDVDPDFWGQGIGTALYDRAFDLAQRFGAQRIYSTVREDRPLAISFADKRGFKQTGRTNRMSGLDVTKANLEGYESLDERMRAEQIRIATLAELGPDDDAVLHSLHDLSNSSARDIPASEVFNLPYDQWLAIMMRAPGSSPDATWVALDADKPVGIAVLQRRGAHSGFNGYTGVDSAYRGKGIARALKLKTIEYARANGIAQIITGNDIDNQRMLAINRRMGYRPLPSSLEVIKEL